jgi:hypothetical protein
VPSDISGTIELDLATEHNLIIQSMASPTGQLIQFSGTVPLQTHSGNLIKFQTRCNKGIITVIGSSNEANVQSMHSPETSNIFNILIENVRSSRESDKDQIIILLEVLRDTLTPGATDNQDLVEKLKQISADKPKFETTWAKSTPLILKSIKELIDAAVMRPSQGTTSRN